MAYTVQTKVCPKCNQYFPATISYFHPEKRRRDGISGWCKKCHNEDCKLRLRRIRLEVLAHYGNQCSCCKETEVKFLSIDHINGQGNKHRKELKGLSIYRWLKRNNYPIGFEILCHNCNLAKGFYGQCPHKEK